MSAPHLGDWNLGPTSEISGRRQTYAAQRFNNLAQEAANSGKHLWVATLGYLVSVPLRGGALLDPDAIIGPPMVSCFVCEQPYETGAESTTCGGLSDGDEWARPL